MTPEQIKDRQDYAVQQNIVILRNRLNSPELAVSEPQVARQGVDRIAIQLPGLQNSAEVKKILGKTATLEFRMVDENSNPLDAAATGRVPLGSKLYYTREKQPVLLKRDVVVTGDQLTDASFQPNTQDGAAVSVGLDSRGAAKMLKNTQENIGHLMAVVFIDRSREKNAQGVDVDKHHRGGHQSRHHPRRIQQQLPDHRRESDRRPRTRAAAARRVDWRRRCRRWKSAPSVPASVRTTSTRACTPWCSACLPPSSSWPSITRFSG